VSGRTVPGRLGLLLGQAGNRDDAALTALAHTAASFQPACVVVKELPAMLRGRAPGEVSALLMSALHAVGLPHRRVLAQADEEAAALTLLEWAQPGDVLVLPVHTASVREALRQRLHASALVQPVAGQPMADL
jgi:UDP-N-acetylmuramyl tripeptide synthase